MNCLHCAETTTQQRTKKTKLGYTTYFCQRCQRTFNEQTGTPWSQLQKKKESFRDKPERINKHHVTLL